MSCSTDYHTLREVVVGRAKHKPLHLHDEPSTRKKLSVAGVISLEHEDDRVKQREKELKEEENLRSKEDKAASWRKEMIRNQAPEKIFSEASKRMERCQSQVDEFVELLKSNDISVLRPDIVPGWEQPAKTPWWEIGYHYGTPCPRDLFIKFGDLVVETYSGWRCRYFEGESYYGVLEDHCEKTNSRFVKMPRGILSERLYPGYVNNTITPTMITDGIGQHHIGETSKDNPVTLYPHSAFTEHCAILEAADIRRFGNDAFLQTGGYSNRKAFKWLKRLLKKEGITLHEMTFEPGHTSYYHLDAKFSAINENTILYAPDPAHKPSKSIFDWFRERDWNLVEAPWREVLVSPEDFTCSGLNLNFLCLAPGKIVLDSGERGTVKFLRDECGCDCITMDFANAFEFGGAFNCWTVDLIRE